MFSSPGRQSAEQQEQYDYIIILHIVISKIHSVDCLGNRGGGGGVEGAPFTALHCFTSRIIGL